MTENKPIQGAVVASPDIREALRKAFNFGQTYWQQADSDSYRQQDKSSETVAKFRGFAEGVCAEFAALASTQPVAAIHEAQRDAVRDAIAEVLGDAYDCMRVWSAWGYGTMSESDFSLVSDDESRLYELADAAIEAMRPHSPSHPRSGAERADG